MDKRVFATSPAGRIVRTRTGYDAFVPNPLPPILNWSQELALAVEEASLALGRLCGIIDTEESLCGPLLLARDAVGGVRSEGRTIQVAELYQAAASGTEPEIAVRLAGNYISALQHASERIKGLPVSLRLMRELHSVLLDGVADPRSSPGEFRRSQNWLGKPGCALSDAWYVPPPLSEMHALLDNWERFLHERSGLPSLVSLSLAQCQYLAIQPFLDMNTLAGAAFGPVLLRHLGAASVQLPLFGRLLERQATQLMHKVLAVCATGCWEEWVCWHLHAVADAAHETFECAMRIRDAHDRQVRCSGVGDPESAARRVLDLFVRYPVLSVSQTVSKSGLARHEAEDALARLESAGFLNRSEGQMCNVFVATDVIAAVDAKSQFPGFSGGTF